MRFPWLRCSDVENLLLALFNLLPVFPLDGAVMLSAALSSKLLPEQAERWVCGLSLVLVAAPLQLPSFCMARLGHGFFCSPFGWR